MTQAQAMGWVWVLDQVDGDHAAAAYLFARVNNMCAGYAHPTPTAAEILGAHRRMCWGLGITTIDRAALFARCRALGLDIIA